MTRKSKHTQGFILPLTLWIIAAMGFAAAVLSEWVSEAVLNAIAIQDKTEAELSFANIRNELIFILARRPKTNRGIEVGKFVSPPTGTSFQDVMNANYTSDRLVTLDGRAHVMASNQRYAVRLQDGKGLLNINIATAEHLGRFFETLQLEGENHSLLTDTLMDYRDEDDLTRLSGAEEADYVRRNLYPPANGRLMSPWEAQRIIGWTTSPEIWNIQFERPVMTTCGSSGFNPNTAPPEILATLIDGLSISDADRLVEHRKTMPFRNARNVGDAAGLILVNQPFFFSFVPGRCIVVDLIDRETNERIRFSLTLLPRQREQPWQIDYVLNIPKAYTGSLDQIDPEVTFPSPEEIVGATGKAAGFTGL
jgi:general secretion pathway protein K